MSTCIYNKSKKELQGRRHYLAPNNFPFLNHPYRDKFLWLLNTILERPIFDRRLKDKPVPLHSKILEKVLGRNYRHILNYLAANEIITIDESYSAGHHSKSYQITPRYLGATWSKVEIADRDLLKHEAERAEVDAKQCIWAKGAFSDLPKWLEQNLRRVECHAPDSVPPLDSLALQKVADGQFFFIPDDYGRIHTNLTNLNKSFRPNLSFEGKRLVAVDIPNSQPLFLGVLCLSEQKAEEQKPSTKSILDTTKSTTNSSHPFPPLCSALCQKMQLPKDLHLYISICEQGRFYEAVQRQFKMETKSQAKDFFFLFLYGGKRSNPPLRAWFKQHFPTVMRTIDKHKKKNYKNLAYQMQKDESHFIFREVVAPLREADPDRFLVTIHDCVAVPEDEGEEALKMMRVAFAGLGLNPNLKLEMW